jgi:hypothetical protein
MKRIIYGALAALTVLANVSSTAAADNPTGPVGAFFTGNELQVRCRFATQLVASYVAGLWDMRVQSALILDGLLRLRGVADAGVEYGLQRLGVFCPPPGVTIGQATDVFCKYLRDSPEKGHTSGAILFSEAMPKAWPCKR